MDRRGERDRPRSLDAVALVGDFRAGARGSLDSGWGEGDAVRDPGGVRSIATCGGWGGEYVKVRCSGAGGMSLLPVLVGFWGRCE